MTPSSCSRIFFVSWKTGSPPREAAEKGGMEVALAVLAATSTTSIVFFPVTFFYGVSRYLFIDLALGVVLSIFASYIFAMTVVPLYCATFIRIDHDETHGEIVKTHMFCAPCSTLQRLLPEALALLRQSGRRRPSSAQSAQ